MTENNNKRKRIRKILENEGEVDKKEEYYIKTQKKAFAKNFQKAVDKKPIHFGTKNHNFLTDSSDGLLGGFEDFILETDDS